MDDDQVGELRSWAAGLTTDTRPEVRAAAKAILLLAADLEAARSQLLEERLIREALEANREDETPGSEADSEEIDSDLRTRLRGYLTPLRTRRE